MMVNDDDDDDDDTNGWLSLYNVVGRSINKAHYNKLICFEAVV